MPRASAVTAMAVTDVSRKLEVSLTTSRKRPSGPWCLQSAWLCASNSARRAGCRGSVTRGGSEQACAARRTSSLERSSHPFARPHLQQDACFVA